MGYNHTKEDVQALIQQKIDTLETVRKEIVRAYQNQTNHGEHFPSNEIYAMSTHNEIANAAQIARDLHSTLDILYGLQEQELNASELSTVFRGLANSEPRSLINRAAFEKDSAVLKLTISNPKDAVNAIDKFKPYSRLNETEIKANQERELSVLRQCFHIERDLKDTYGSLPERDYLYNYAPKEQQYSVSSVDIRPDLGIFSHPHNVLLEQAIFTRHQIESMGDFYAKWDLDISSEAKMFESSPYDKGELYVDDIPYMFPYFMDYLYENGQCTPHLINYITCDIEALLEYDIVKPADEAQLETTQSEQSLDLEF